MVTRTLTWKNLGDKEVRFLEGTYRPKGLGTTQITLFLIDVYNPTADTHLVARFEDASSARIAYFDPGLLGLPIFHDPDDMERALLGMPAKSLNYQGKKPGTPEKEGGELKRVAIDLPRAPGYRHDF